MAYLALKVLITALLVVAISEISKRSTAFGAIVASLPLTSLLAFIWLYTESGDSANIARLSTSIFWYVLLSLVLFLALPALLAAGIHFWPSLLLASAMTFAAYLAMTAILSHYGITL